MYILYFIQNGKMLVLVVSEDINRLKAYPNFDIDWLDMSSDTRTIWHGKSVGVNGWWLIEPVLKI